MRIVHVLDSSSRLGGGIFESVKGLAQAMTAGGEDVVVLSGADRWSEADRPSWGAVTPRLAPSSSLADNILGRGLARALIEAQPDIVHLHGLWGIGARATASWARRTGRPVAISPHGMLDPWALARSAAKKRLSQAMWEGRLLSRAGFLHALNMSEADSVAAAGWRRPVVVLPNGVDMPERTARGEGGRSQAEGGRKILLFLGRLHPKKGLEELIRGWAALAPSPRDGWMLRIAGWDEMGMQPGLAALAGSLGIADTVDFPGPVYGKEKDAVFRTASAFILPSHSEGLPMAVLEAWSYELPVFMTAACNLPQGFSAGAAFEIGAAPDAITPVLARILNDDAALDAAGRHGRMLTERDHAWPAIARAMRAAYADIAP